MKQFCATLLDDLDYQIVFLRDWRARTLAPAIEQMVWYYAAGKPRELIDLSVQFPHKLLLGHPGVEGDAPPEFTDD